MKHVLILLTVGIVLLSCHSPTPAPKQNVQVYLRYLTEEGLLHAEANFVEKAAGTDTAAPVQLPQPPALADDPMKWRAQNSQYTLDEPSGYPAIKTLKWRTADRKDHTLNIAMPSIFSFGFGTDAVSRSNPARFAWQGGAFEKGESFVFMWDNTQSRETVPMEIVGAPGSTTIEFPAAQMAKLSAGEWSLYLVRKKLQMGSVDDIPYEVITEFFSAPVQITVTP